MSVYYIVELTVTDPEWLPEYADKVTKMVEARGGKYLARTAEVAALEGGAEPETLVVLVEWPSQEIAEEFYDSDEYKPFKEARKAGSKGTFLMISDKDDTGMRTA